LKKYYGITGNPKIIIANINYMSNLLKEFYRITSFVITPPIDDIFLICPKRIKTRM
jgi:hypothetical protein